MLYLLFFEVQVWILLFSSRDSWTEMSVLKFKYNNYARPQLLLIRPLLFAFIAVAVAVAVAITGQWG